MESGWSRPGLGLPRASSAPAWRELLECLVLGTLLGVKTSYLWSGDDNILCIFSFLKVLLMENSFVV
jgi:hypothetical protein